MRKGTILFFVFLLFVPVIAGCAKPPSGTVQQIQAETAAAHASGEFIRTQPQTQCHRDPAEQQKRQAAEPASPPVQPAEPEEPLPDPGDESPVIPTVEINSASSHFDFALFEQLTAQAPATNVVLSPLSVRMALAMAYNGSDGAAKEAMAEVLDFDGLTLDEVNSMMEDLSQGQQDESVQLEIANSFWGQEEERFYEAIVQACRDYYGAELQRVDFKDPGVVQLINAWADEKTHGKIPVIVPDYEMIKYNRFAWMNAIYFKAAWASQFKEGLTSEEDFILPDGQRIKVPLMRQSEKLAYLENEDFQAVCLPYKGGRLGMYAVSYTHLRAHET